MNDLTYQIALSVPLGAVITLMVVFAPTSQGMANAAIEHSKSPPNQWTELENGSSYMPNISSMVMSLRGFQNTIEHLGWNEMETLETRLRLGSFAQDWNAPGMEAYDDL